MSGERRFRIVSTKYDDKWRVQYGFDSRRLKTTRFKVIREWVADDFQQAHQIVAREKIAVVLDPPPVDAKTLPDRHHLRRRLKEAPDAVDTLCRALDGLSDPLPTIEESHARLETEAPYPRADGGRQFNVWLNEAVYAQLVAMAAAAEVTRNKLIEALVLAAGENV